MSPRPPARVRQERDRVPPRTLHLVMSALAALLLVGAGLTWLAERGADARIGWRREAAPAVEMPREIEGVDQSLFGAQLPSAAGQERARRELSTYGWTDRNARRVRIPIQRAMDIVAGQDHVE